MLRTLTSSAVPAERAASHLELYLLKLVHVQRLDSD